MTDNNDVLRGNRFQSEDGPQVSPQLPWERSAKDGLYIAGVAAAVSLIILICTGMFSTDPNGVRQTASTPLSTGAAVSER